jgi:hypothetical protein
MATRLPENIDLPKCSSTACYEPALRLSKRYELPPRGP